MWVGFTIALRFRHCPIMPRWYPNILNYEIMEIYSCNCFFFIFYIFVDIFITRYLRRSSYTRTSHNYYFV